MTYDNLPAVRPATRPIVRSRVSRELVRRVERAEADGVVAATRVEMGSFVAHVALHSIGMASETEARLTRAHPTGAERYQLIVDSLTALAANEIDGLAKKWWRS